MTPTIKSITLTDGTRLEDRGEVRAPKKDEWYTAPSGAAYQADGDFAACLEYPILSPVEAPAGGIERRGDWWIRQPDKSGTCVGANALIDAACAVVNDAARDSGFGPEIALVKSHYMDALAATLEPFTQPVKPKDRYYVEDMAVYDREGGFDPDVSHPRVATFTTEQDAKAFASMKNQKEQGSK